MEGVTYVLLNNNNVDDNYNNNDSYSTAYQLLRKKREKNPTLRISLALIQACLKHTIFL